MQLYIFWIFHYVISGSIARIIHRLATGYISGRYNMEETVYLFCFPPIQVMIVA